MNKTAILLVCALHVKCVAVPSRDETDVSHRGGSER